MRDIELGMPYTFVPAPFIGERDVTRDGETVRRAVTGRVCYINGPHRYFTVSFTLGRGYPMKESFKIF